MSNLAGKTVPSVVTDSTPDDGHSGGAARAPPSRLIAPWYLAYLILGLITSGMLPFLLPLMVANITDDPGRIAYIVGAYNAGLLPAPLLGRLAERYRLFRLVFFGGFAALCFGLGAAAIAMSLTAWVGLAVLCGLGAGAVATVAPLFVFSFAPKSEWNARIGWLQGFSGAGQLAGLLLVGLILLGPSFTASGSPLFCRPSQSWLGTSACLPADGAERRACRRLHGADL